MVGLRRVDETRLLPYQRICVLTITGTGGTELATGWLFGDNLVITAAHVLEAFDQNAEIEVCPAQSAAHDKPFGAWPARTFRRSTTDAASDRNVRQMSGWSSELPA